MMKDLDDFILFQVSISSLDFHFLPASPKEFHFLFILFINDLFINCAFLNLILHLFYEIFFIFLEFPIILIIDFRFLFHFSSIPLSFHLFLI